ncbi:30S ribosomal protein S9 [Candidatus Parcubacteria bacterium]|nr:30S ribosomal protein S9 [Candidatus Parcubacteria bacterium]
MEKIRYIESVGRRKSAIARVRITPSAKADMTVNEQAVPAYFKTEELRSIIGQAMKVAAIEQKFHVTVKVVGSGIHSQAEAVRHGLARALIEYDRELRGRLKKEGYLKRDPRKKERKKFGLKKARKAPTWSKR